MPRGGKTALYLHWEGNTVIKGHKESGLKMVIERRSGYLLAVRILAITVTRTDRAMTRLLTPPRQGNSSHHHPKVAKAASTKTYFCNTYRSGQHGTNENTNDLMHQYFLKGQSSKTAS